MRDNEDFQVAIGMVQNRKWVISKGDGSVDAFFKVVGATQEVLVFSYIRVPYGIKKIQHGLQISHQGCQKGQKRPILSYMVDLVRIWQS